MSTRVWPLALQGEDGYVAQKRDEDRGMWMDIAPPRKNRRLAEADIAQHERP